MIKGSMDSINSRIYRRNLALTIDLPASPAIHCHAGSSRYFETLPQKRAHPPCKDCLMFFRLLNKEFLPHPLQLSFSPAYFCNHLCSLPPFESWHLFLFIPQSKDCSLEKASSC